MTSPTTNRDNSVTWEALPPNADALQKLFAAELRAINPSEFENPGLWLGVNYQCVTASCPEVAPLARHPDRPLLVHMNEAAWKKNLPTFPLLGFGPPTLIEMHDGVAENKSAMVEHLLGKDKHCVVRYWGLEIADNNGETGDKGCGEPRAQLLCEALTGHTFPHPYHFVYAHVTRLTPTVEAPKPRAKEEDARSAFTGLKKGFLETLPEATPKPTGASHTGYCFEKDTYVFEPGPDPNGRSGGEDVAEPVWRDAPPPPDLDDACDPEDMRAQAGKLRQKAEAQAALGDHQTAYTTAADAIALQVRASRAEETMAISSGEDRAPVSPPRRLDAPGPPLEPLGPEPEARKTFFPEAQYLYPDGTVRTVPAGMYTQEEFLDKTMEEQGRWADAMGAFKDAAGYEPAAASSSSLTRDAMSKYEAPLTRTPSEAVSISDAEALAPRVASASERARNVLAATEEAKID